MKKVKFFASYCSEEQIYKNIISSWGKGKDTYKDILITKEFDYEYAVLLNLASPNYLVKKENIIGFSHEPRMILGLSNDYISAVSNHLENYFLSNNQGLPETFKEGYSFVCPFEFGPSEGVDYPHQNKMSMIMSLSKGLPGHKMRYEILERVLKTDMDIHFYAAGLNKIYTDERVKEFNWDLFAIPYEQYQTQIVCENVIDGSWSTEKFSNCIIKKTLPIYYGSKKIADEFYGEDNILMLTEDPDQNLEIIKNAYYDSTIYDRNKECINNANHKLYSEKNLLEFLNNYFK
jgi:hypothetical protein